MSAEVIPFRRGTATANPYDWGTPLWLAFRQGADAQDEKWRSALARKLAPEDAR